MLTASPVQNKIEQKEAAVACGFPFRPDSFAYSQKEDGVLIAAAQFDITSDGGVFTDIAMVKGLEDDVEALFILGRAVLNFLDLAGIDSCTFDSRDAHGEKMARMLGFKNDGITWRIVLKGLFDGKCHN